MKVGNQNTIAANKIISGKILKISDQHITVDIGYKSEGQIPKEEFLNTGSMDDLKTGQEIEVFVEKLEDREGNVKVSHEKAIKMKSWEKLQKVFDNKERVKGFIVGKAKAGLYVKIMGTNAFLPLSQIDVRPVRDVSHLIDVPQRFKILKMDLKRNNIVVSRRAVLEEMHKEVREERFLQLKLGDVVDGKIKAITDYGAFVDLGSYDSLLHSSDITYKRIGHPSEVLKIDQKIKCKIIKVDPEKNRVSVGMKQLEDDPWNKVKDKFNVNLSLEVKLMGFKADEIEGLC